MRIHLTRPAARRWAGAFMLLWLAGCDPAPAGQEGDEARAPSVTDNLILASSMVALPPPGTAPADLPEPSSDGAAHLREFCTACHALPSPSTHSATDWPVVLRRMWLRIEGVAAQYDLPVPSSAERVAMLNYLLEHSLEVTGSTLPDAPGRQLFSSTCSRCHELPDPRQHSSNDWAAVVIRMRQHMVQMLRESPPQTQVQEIILYLERASRASN
jgi:cytochrome c5